MDHQTNNNSTTCRRCGTCCEQGGPALHYEDRQQLESGALTLRDLVTIREGEPVYDQLRNQITPAEKEFIKLAGTRGSWSCRFYDKAQGCGIYGHRPVECRLLFCQETAPLEKVMGKDLICRRDLLSIDDPALEWMAELDREIAYREVTELLAGLDSPAYTDSLSRLTSLVHADLTLRESFLRNLPTRGNDELFILGRPLFLTIAPYGCRLVKGAWGMSLQYIRP